MDRRTFLGASLLSVIGLPALAACGRGDEGSSGGAPGVTDSAIKIGGLWPLSGPNTAFGTIGRSTQAYFKMLNDTEGGIKMKDGKTRKVEYLLRDNAYDPAKTLQEAKRLVEEDEVFCLLGTDGTSANLAIAEYIDKNKVPNFFISSGLSDWGSGKYEYTIGWQPVGAVESDIYAQYLAANHPGGKVGILYQNDDLGKEHSNFLQKSLESTDITVVGIESYELSDATVDTQVVKLQQSGADIFYNGSSPKFAAQAIKKAYTMGWEAIQIVPSYGSNVESAFKPAGLDASTGILSAFFLKDAGDPQWAEDPAMVDYHEKFAEYASDMNSKDYFNLFGWVQGESAAGQLARMETPDREDFMKLLKSIDPPQELGLLLPGVQITTSSDALYPVQAMQVQQFTGSGWESKGDAIKVDTKK